MPDQVIANRQLMIAPSSLVPGAVYSFGVTVSDTAAFVSRAVLNVSVVPSDLVALIDGSTFHAAPFHSAEWKG